MEMSPSISPMVLRQVRARAGSPAQLFLPAGNLELKKSACSASPFASTRALRTGESAQRQHPAARCPGKGAHRHKAPLLSSSFNLEKTQQREKFAMPSIGKGMRKEIGSNCSVLLLIPQMREVNKIVSETRFKNEHSDVFLHTACSVFGNSLQQKGTKSQSHSKRNRQIPRAHGPSIALT